MNYEKWSRHLFKSLVKDNIIYIYSVIISLLDTFVSDKDLFLGTHVGLALKLLD